ncbi:MAG: class I tRNA ligase family protein [Candidatus Paceibacterota bacterium]
MPQWAGSSWYYLRYEDPKNKKQLVNPKTEKYWSSVDLYVGGAEHATRHLIYARFWHKFLYDTGVVSTVEPFKKLQHVGLVMGEDGRKMSKRFGNIINPDEVVKTYGADSLRVYEMFMGPFDQQIAWNTPSMVGSRRFIERVWKLKEKIAKNISDSDLKNIDRIVHKTTKKVTDDIETMRFNTAISSLMILVNEIEKSLSITKGQYEILLQLLAPFAPHATEELWAQLGNKKSIHISKWPEYNASLAVDNEVTIMVQVNSKIRGSFMAETNISKEDMEKKAQEVPEVKKWLENKKIVKIIVVPNRLVNLVVV